MLEEKKRKTIKWIKDHKKELIIAGISITVLVGIIIGIKNKDDLEKILLRLRYEIKQQEKYNTTIIEKTKNTNVVIDLPSEPRKYSLPIVPVDVRRHIRNLSGDRVPSLEKQKEAERLGIALGVNQTLVDSYTKYRNKAA